VPTNGTGLRLRKIDGRRCELRQVAPASRVAKESQHQYRNQDNHRQGGKQHANGIARWTLSRPWFVQKAQARAAGCAQLETKGELGKVSPVFCWLERLFVAEAERLEEHALRPTPRTTVKAAASASYGPLAHDWAGNQRASRTRPISILAVGAAPKSTDAPATSASWLEASTMNK